MSRSADQRYEPRTPDSPRVSIVICTHNYGRFLDQALTSAARQSHACEIVVVDDGSTDDTRRVLEPWHDRATIVHRDQGGQRLAYETGLNNSTGEFVIFLDADDQLVETAVSQVLAAFQPDIAKVHFRLQLVDDETKPLGPVIPSRLARGDVASDFIRRGLLYASAPGSGNAYRRSAIAPLFPLPYDRRELHGADYFLIYGCVFAGKVAAIDEPLAQYRVHDASLTAHGSLVFGNAEASCDLEPETRFEKRAAQLREWLRERTGGQVEIPGKLLDFSQQKAIFVRKVFAGSYAGGIARGAFRLPDLFESVWRSKAFPPAHKAALSGWALAVLVLPRRLGRPIARYVSNPASR